MKTVSMTLALTFLATLPRAFALAPPVGPIATPVLLSQGPSTNPKGMTFTRQLNLVSGPSLDLLYTVTRPGQANVIFERFFLLGQTFDDSAAFVGDHGLVITDSVRRTDGSTSSEV